MIVVDTSVWVELLRATGSRAHGALRAALERDAPIALTEIVFMELMAGAAGPAEARSLRERLFAFPMLTLRGLADYEEAAAIYRACRLAGETLRHHADCLVAVPALRAGAEVMHADRGFDAIARHTDLRIHEPPAEDRRRR